MKQVGRPRLLVLSSTYPRWPGDPEPGFVHELSRRLVSTFEVTVLCPHAPGALTRESMDGVTVVRYRYAPSALQTLVNEGGIGGNLQKHVWKWLLVPGFLLSLIWNLFRLLRLQRPDVIHAHWLIPQGLVVALLKYCGLTMPPYLVTSHGADLFSLRAPALQVLKRFAAAQAADMTVVSEAMRVEAQRQMPLVTGMHVCPMGVDLQQRFVMDARVERSANELLFVGRLVEKKGLRHLVDALPIILSTKPHVRLTVVGYGPEETALREQVRRLHLDSAVRFLGAVEQEALPALYQRAALFVAPFVEAASGDQEGLGLVVIEAIGCGCPAVVSDLPATRDIALEGWPRPTAGDPASIASAVLSILDLPRAQQARLVEANRARLATDFDWSRVANGYAQRLEQLVMRRACGAGSTL